MSDRTPFVVGFYNVENLFDTENDPYTNDDWFTANSPLEWTDERYGRKLRNLAQVLLSMPHGAPAIMGLAEVENARVLEDLNEELNWQGMGMDFIHEESPDERGIDVALLYHPERFQYIEHDIHPVRFDVDPDDKTRDILQVTGVMGGEEVHVFVNHWPSRSEGVEESRPKREAAARVLREEVDGLLEDDPSARIIIMGDLNDYPTDSSVKEVLRAGPHPAYAQGDLLNLSYNPHWRGEGTHVHKGNWGMLDHIIVTEGIVHPQAGLKLASQEVNIMNEDWLLYRNSRKQIVKPSRTYAGKKYHGGYSDHLPVYIELTV